MRGRYLLPKNPHTPWGVCAYYKTSLFRSSVRLYPIQNNPNEQNKKTLSSRISVPPSFPTLLVYCLLQGSFGCLCVSSLLSLVVLKWKFLASILSDHLVVYCWPHTRKSLFCDDLSHTTDYTFQEKKKAFPHTRLWSPSAKPFFF